MQQVQKYSIDYHVSELYWPEQNATEGVIRELHKKWFCIMVKKKVPKRLWDYVIRWVAEILQYSANSCYSRAGRSPIEKLSGETPDISEYLNFGFYDFVRYKDKPGVIEDLFGCWLGILHRAGNVMSFWIPTNTCHVVSQLTVQYITNLENQAEVIRTYKMNLTQQTLPK